MSTWQFKVYQSINELLAEQRPVKRQINKIVLHYSAIPAPAPKRIIEQLEAIDKYHREANGWKGIGYHIAIHPNGTVASCRPLRLSGAHANGHNNTSIGVVMLIDDFVANSPEPLMSTTIGVLGALCKEFSIPKEAVFLHRQLNPTVCPPIGQAFVDKLRKSGFTSISLKGGGK